MIAASDSGRASRVRHAARWAGALLLLMAITLLATIERKSITNDETIHIPAGYYHLVAGDFHVNNEHPPLAKMWSAIPLLLLQPQEPPAVDVNATTSQQLGFSILSRFWLDNEGLFERISFWTRVPMIALTVALGSLIFATARRGFNDRAALFAVALFATEPTVLAHGRTVHTDVPAAFVYLGFFSTLSWYLGRPGLRRAALLGLTGGVALVTKYSLIALVVPVIGGVIAVRLWQTRDATARRRVAGHAGVVTALALLVVNLAYWFQRPPLDPGDVQWVASQTPVFFGAIMQGISWLSWIVPTYFLFGFYNVAIHNYYGHSAFLLGRFSDSGWWWYFPAAFALKTSLPFLGLTIGTLAWALWAASRQHHRAARILIGPCLLYVGLAMTANINIGVRHLLPAYPFLFILGGALLDRLLGATRFVLAARTAVAVTLLWAGLEAVRAYPDYMTYMNQLAWREPRYQYLSDSNTEWGDEVKELADYLKARGQTRVRAALLGGWLTLARYGVGFVDLFDRPPGEIPETAYVAIGASFLNGSTVPGGGPGSGRDTSETRINYFAEYRRKAPEAVFAHSIYLYRGDARE
jgi:Dolichyl-phosphate-mannose-protein mannosyltransferase